MYGLHFVYIDLFILYTKKGVFGSPKLCCHEFMEFVGHFGHKMADFLRPQKGVNKIIFGYFL